MLKIIALIILLIIYVAIWLLVAIDIKLTFGKPYLKYDKSTIIWIWLHIIAIVLSCLYTLFI